MAIQNPVALLGEIAAAAAGRSKREQRFPEAALPGEYVRQGDIYITLLKRLPRGAVPVEPVRLQLAVGTSIGSRHELDSGEGVEQFVLSNPTALDGPILRLSCERRVLHPDHGTWVLSPGVYEITYQRSLAEELRSVVD